MKHHIKDAIYQLLNEHKNQTIRMFIDTDDNHFEGILNANTFVYGDDHIVLDNPKNKYSGDLNLKEAFIKISSIISFTYIVIDLENNNVDDINGE